VKGDIRRVNPFGKGREVVRIENYGDNVIFPQRGERLRDILSAFERDFALV
jgi:hypothetical protein